jgi:phosphoglycerate dehydrogenase-like enzyme
VKILIASPIYADALEHLRKDNDVVTAFDAGSEELIQRIRDREVLVFRSGVDITADV